MAASARGPEPVAGMVGVDLGPGVRAGFTTRHAAEAGHAASAVHASGAVHAASGGRGFNLGLGVGEQPAVVRARRRLVARWAGGPVGWSTQVHGTTVLDLTDRPPPTDDGEPAGEADALVAARGTGAAVVVADCVPVLLADPGSGVVAAVHAGRRGLADGVVQAAVARMVAGGARPADVRAAIGPAICGRCYEVPAGLRDAVADVVPGVASRTSWGTPALDLPGGVALVLREAGVGHVHATALCTRTDERFFSHRRSVAAGEPQGRCAAVVRSDTPGPGVSDGGRGVAGC